MCCRVEWSVAILLAARLSCFVSKKVWKLAIAVLMLLCHSLGLVQAGGVLTSLYKTNQQWDAPLMPGHLYNTSL